MERNCCLEVQQEQQQQDGDSNGVLFQVDGKSSGKTCLQVACHQGHMDMVRLLLDHKASLDIADDDGDLALHYAAFG